MEKLLNLGNGAKTITGIVLLLVMSAVCKVTGIDIPAFEEAQSVTEVGKLLGVGLGAILTITGWSDKIAKVRTESLRKELDELKKKVE